MLDYHLHVPDPSLGRFIAFEGGEGSGKSTQMNLLRERSSVLFPHEAFIFTREPGGSLFAEKARTLLVSDDAADLDGITQLLLVGSGRADHLRRVIEPSLKAGKNVVTDRFVPSTFNYQFFSSDTPVLEAFFWQYCKTLKYLPHVTLIFDIDPKLGAERAARRRNQAVSHFDARRLEFHEKVREGYLTWSRMFPQYCEIIDAGLSEEEVHEQVVTCLSALCTRTN